MWHCVDGLSLGTRPRVTFGECRILWCLHRRRRDPFSTTYLISLYRRYYETSVKRVDENSVVRVGWAWSGFCPNGAVGEGVGSDLFSVGFDGRHIWYGGVKFPVLDGARRLLPRKSWMVVVCTDALEICLTAAFATLFVGRRRCRLYYRLYAGQH